MKLPDFDYPMPELRFLTDEETKTLRETNEKHTALLSGFSMREPGKITEKELAEFHAQSNKYYKISNGILEKAENEYIKRQTLEGALADIREISDRATKQGFYLFRDMHNDFYFGATGENKKSPVSKKHTIKTSYAGMLDYLRSFSTLPFKAIDAKKIPQREKDECFRRAEEILKKRAADFYTPPKQETGRAFFPGDHTPTSSHTILTTEPAHAIGFSLLYANNLEKLQSRADISVYTKPGKRADQESGDLTGFAKTFYHPDKYGNTQELQIDLDISSFQKFVGSSGKQQQFFRYVFDKLGSSYNAAGGKLPDRISLTTAELLESGLYSKPSNAYNALKECVPLVKLLSMSITKKDESGTGLSISIFPDYYKEPKKGLFVLLVNPRFTAEGAKTLELLTEYTTDAPKYIYSLRPTADLLTRALFRRARQTRKTEVHLSFTQVIKELGLPDFEETDQPRRDILNKIETAVSEINAKQAEEKNENVKVWTDYNAQAALQDIIKTGKVFLRLSGEYKEKIESISNSREQAFRKAKKTDK